MNIREKERGVSLIELMLAIAVFVIGSAAVIQLFIGSQISMNHSLEKLQASFLAKEGIESVRSTRDTGFNNIVHGVFQDTVLLNGKEFGREIDISSFREGEVEVVSTITWVSAAREGSFSLVEYITDWRSGTTQAGGGGSTGITVNLGQIEEGQAALVTWNSISGAEEYRIELYINGLLEEYIIKGGTSHTFSSFLFFNGDEVYVRIRAEATESNPASSYFQSAIRVVGSLQHNPPGSVSLQEVSAGGSASVSWGSVATAGEYRVVAYVNDGQVGVVNTENLSVSFSCGSCVAGDEIYIRVRVEESINYLASDYAQSNTRIVFGNYIQASGGDSVYTFVGDGNNGIVGQTYKVHEFRSTGSASFNITHVPGESFVEYLIIGGGGGGSAMTGGGAGGYREGTTSVSVQSYPIVVGAGGQVYDGINQPGISGGNSSVFGFIATGGGGGGAEGSSDPAPSGGSGGGGHLSGGGGNVPSVSPSQGNNGAGMGAATSGCAGDGGGGGGAGSAGLGRNGGSGRASFFTGISVVRAGGGAGELNLDCGGASGDGGSGGGGGSRIAGESGKGGGGGSRAGGGHGIVIVRYLIDN